MEQGYLLAQAELTQMLRQWDADTAPLDSPDNSTGLSRVDRRRAGRDPGPGDFNATRGFSIR